MNVEPTPEAMALGILAADASALRSIAACMNTEAELLHKTSLVRRDMSKYAGQLSRAADAIAATIRRVTPAGPEGTIS